MTVYKSWAQVMADAALGKLEWDTDNHSGGLYNYIRVHDITVAQARQLLPVVKATQPNKDWVRDGLVSISADGKSVEVLAQPIPPSAPGAADIPKGLGKPFTGNFAPFNVLFDKNLWIRLAEFAVGALLLGIGANALVKSATGVDVAGTGRKVVKTATRVAL